MNFQTLIILCLFPLFAYSQKITSMSDSEIRLETSMDDVDGRVSNGKYLYFEKGSNIPYTGVLFAKYPDGQILSWQEFIDGIGQGKWINYYENGNIKEIGHYEQNKVEGPIKKYYSNGQLKAIGMYKDWRIRIGEWKYFKENGDLLKIEDYGEKGNIDEVKAYYERGDINYSWYKQILDRNRF